MQRALVRILLILLFAAGLMVASAPADDPGDNPPAAAGQSPAEADEEPLGTFVPSEKLPADSAVAFPVDI